MKLKVHNPCNEITRYYRNYNLFWDEFTDELKKRHDVIENRYYKNSHFERFEVSLGPLTNSSPLLLHECEYVIENLEDGTFYVLSVADLLSHCILSQKKNPNLKKVLISQFIDYNIEFHVGKNFSKYSPWIYFPMTTLDLEKYYNERKNKKEFINKMFFWGNTNDRPILSHFDKSLLEGPIVGEPQDIYFSNLINYNVALSIAGVGEFCYRDIECMAVGIPFLRFGYQSKMYEDLIPNYHYISINYNNTIPKNNNVHTDRLGNKEHSQQIEQRFNEVKDDKEFLKFVSYNARKYYVDHLTSPNRIIKTLEILNL